MPEHQPYVRPEGELGYIRELHGEILEDLDSRITIVDAFEKTIKAISLEDPPEKVRAKLESTFAEVIEWMPAESKEQYERYKSIPHEDDQVRQQLEILYSQRPEGASFEQRQSAEIHLLWDQRRELKDELHELSQSASVRFIDNLLGVNTKMIDKNEKVQALGDNPQKVLTEFHRETGVKGVTTDDIVLFERGPFEYTITLTNAGFDKLDPRQKSAGLHYQGTPFSFIRSSTPNRESIKSHESLHNIIDGAADINTFGESLVMSNINQLLKTPNDAYWKNEFFRLDARQLIDLLHNEILAGLEKAESTLFPHVQTMGLREQKNFFIVYTQKFSTAGSQAREILIGLETLANGPADSHIRDRAAALADEFQSTFVRTVDTMAETINTANDVGSKTSRAVHQLLFILPPSKYRHIGRYLRKKSLLPAEKMGKNDAESETKNTS